jgi:hypothetical protein
MPDDSSEISPKGRPILSDSFTEELIHMPKYIPKGIKNPFKPKEDNGHLRSSISLTCNKPEYRFTLSTRKLIKDPTDFSVVFTYIDVNGREYIIRRFNGDHGRHYHNRTGQYISGPHIHTITESAQRDLHKDETDAVETNQYKTLEQAIEFALRQLNIVRESGKGIKTLNEWC